MSRTFLEIFLGYMLVVLSLIPMVILLGELIALFPNSIFWMLLSIMLLAFITYLTYRLENKKGKK